MAMAFFLYIYRYPHFAPRAQNFQWVLFFADNYFFIKYSISFQMCPLQRMSVSFMKFNIITKLRKTIIAERTFLTPLSTI